MVKPFKRVNPELSRQDFLWICDFIREKSGLHFDASKKDSLRMSLLARTTRLELGSYKEYFDYLRSDSDGEEEFKRLLDLITINETYFFRDKAQFDALRQQILPQLITRKQKQDKRLTIWSAGCSTGEEPYSIAMVLNDVLPLKKGWEILILASDVSQQALEIARRGVYKEKALRNTEPYYKRRYFRRKDNLYVVIDKIKKMVDFRYFNLISDPYPPFNFSKWDIIFCRNVTIYFKMESTKRVVSNFHDILRKDGYLFLGYSESLRGISEQFHLIQAGDAFLYQKGSQEQIERTRKHDRLPKRNAKVWVSRARKETRSVSQVTTAKVAIPEMDVSSYEELYQQALMEIREEHFQKAVQKLEELLKKGYQVKEILLTLAWVYSAVGKEDEALVHSEKVISMDPLNQDAYFLRGVIYRSQGDKHRAIEEFKKSLYVRSDYILARIYLGDLYYQEGQIQRSAREYRNALKFLKKNPGGYLGPFAGGFTAETLVQACSHNLEKLQQWTPGSSTDKK